MARKISQKVDDEQREARRNRESQQVFEQADGALPVQLDVPEIAPPDTADEPYQAVGGPALEDFDLLSGATPQEAAVQERERQESLGRYYRQGKTPPPYLMQPPASAPSQDDMGLPPGVTPPGEDAGGTDGMGAMIQAMHQDISAKLDALTELVQGITEEGGATWQ